MFDLGQLATGFMHKVVSWHGFCLSCQGTSVVRAFETGEHKQMFKNNIIDNFWVDWTVEQNVNISLSDYPTTGTAS